MLTPVTITFATRSTNGTQSPPVEIPLDREFLARYRVGPVLGQGGMGMVLEATHRETGERVAVKFLIRPEDAESARRFALEGRLLTSIRHPSVVKVLECGMMSGHPYLVCEHLGGGTLRDRLAREPRLTPADAVALMTPVLAGLHACHERGVIHRDIKPENILFDEDGVPKLADLGIAKSYAAGDTRLTQTGMIVGTPKYMSPEQARGDSVGVASDIYAAGCVLYELLSGVTPFDNESFVIVLHAHMMAEPVALKIRAPAVSDALAGVVHAALAKKISDRPASADNFATRLRKALARPDASRPAMKSAAPMPPSARPGEADPRPLVAAAACLTIVLLAAAWRIHARVAPPPVPPTLIASPVELPLGSPAPTAAESSPEALKPIEVAKSPELPAPVAVAATPEPLAPVAVAATPEPPAPVAAASSHAPPAPTPTPSAPLTPEPAVVARAQPSHTPSPFEPPPDIQPGPPPPGSYEDVRARSSEPPIDVPLETPPPVAGVFPPTNVTGEVTVDPLAGLPPSEYLHPAPPVSPPSLSPPPEPAPAFTGGLPPPPVQPVLNWPPPPYEFGGGQTPGTIGVPPGLIPGQPGMVYPGTQPPDANTWTPSTEDRRPRVPPPDVPPSGVLPPAPQPAPPLGP